MRLLFCLSLILVYFSSCTKDEEMEALNLVAGNEYVLTSIGTKSLVLGFTREGGTIRPLSQTELLDYSGIFSYTDANDENFLGQELRFVGNDLVNYGPAGFEGSSDYVIVDDTITIFYSDDDGEYEDYLLIESAQRLTKVATYFRQSDSTGTFDTDGGSFSASFLDERQADLIDDGDVFTYVTATWVYTQK